MLSTTNTGKLIISDAYMEENRKQTNKFRREKYANKWI